MKINGIITIVIYSSSSNAKYQYYFNITDRKYYPFGKGKIVIKFSDSLKMGLVESDIKEIENLELGPGFPKYN